MNVKVRFAPSPTGVLHIGSARTALFNFLYAKHTNGQFFIRVEDTDAARSTEESGVAILKGLKWLGILPEEKHISYQSKNLARHQEVAKKLVENGAAYYCYTPLFDEVEGKPREFNFKSQWRDEATRPKDIPNDVKPVIRLKAVHEGETVLEDIIQGSVVIQNSQIDDMVLLRGDGSSTFILACAVDDYDMGITHVIRGDDHLNNTFRQLQIFNALGWKYPLYAHIPLIHGKDGSKLSKRHGALGIDHYIEEGYLPEAIINYLLRLGWGHGNDEIISMKQAIEWFDIKDVKKSPAQFDFDKLLSLNAHYIKAMDNAELVSLLCGRLTELTSLSKDKREILTKGIGGVKLRAKTLNALFEQSKFYILDEPIEVSDDSKVFIESFDKALLNKLIEGLQGSQSWDEVSLKAIVEAFMQANSLQMSQVAHVLRALLAGVMTSPGIFDMMLALGKEKALLRLNR